MKKKLSKLIILLCASFFLYAEEKNLIRNKVEQSNIFKSHSEYSDLKFIECIKMDDGHLLKYSDSSLSNQIGFDTIVYFLIKNERVDCIYSYPYRNISNMQLKYVQNFESTTLFADFDFDEHNEYMDFSIIDFNCYIQFFDFFNDYGLIKNDYCTNTDFFVSEGIIKEPILHNLIESFFKSEFIFCIVNNKRGICINTYFLQNNAISTFKKFFYWSPAAQRYMLDESVPQEQLKNAYCPEDYFAYNGLQFSKLGSKLTEADLKDLDKAQLRLMRNAVYARHGRIFKSADLQSLWECYAWYKKNPAYTDDLLTETDRYNIELIKRYESK